MKILILILATTITMAVNGQNDRSSNERAEKQVAKITAQIELTEQEKKALYNECVIFQSNTLKLREKGKKMLEADYEQEMIETRKDFYVAVTSILSSDQKKAEWAQMNRNLLVKK